MTKILHLATTVPESLFSLLRGQPHRLSEQFSVTLISSPGIRLDQVGVREGVPTHGVPMTRSITPIADAIATWRMFRWFRDTRPDLVQSYTPKAGLVVMAAAALARVPVRVHGVVGMPLMEVGGWRRKVLQVAERLTYAFSTDLTCNSIGLRDWIIANLNPMRPITVLSAGSINGVDLDYFVPSKGGTRQAARDQLGLTASDVVLLYVGRLVRAKGVEELLGAFAHMRAEGQNVTLLLVGAQEPDLDPLSAEALEQLRRSDGIVQLGWSDDVRPHYAAADVFVLPSYREGLPNALLEASASGLACVASDINGCNEVIDNGSTGALIPPKDQIALTSALLKLMDVELRARLGRSARLRMEKLFDRGRFWNELISFYEDLLSRSS